MGVRTLSSQHVFETQQTNLIESTNPNPFFKFLKWHEYVPSLPIQEQIETVRNRSNSTPINFCPSPFSKFILAPQKKHACGRWGARTEHFTAGQLKDLGLAVHLDVVLAPRSKQIDGLMSSKSGIFLGGLDVVAIYRIIHVHIYITITITKKVIVDE